MKNIYIETSGIHGKGVRAGERMKKGEIIELIKGKLKFLEIKNKKDSLSYPNWIGVGKNKWIDTKEPFKFLNHSCDPNVGIKGKVNVVAIKNIKEGEEITLDYSITESDELWEMKCECKATNCRGIIRSIQFLPQKTFNKYLPYIPTYFKNVYLSHKLKIIK